MTNHFLKKSRRASFEIHNYCDSINCGKIERKIARKAFFHLLEGPTVLRKHMTDQVVDFNISLVICFVHSTTETVVQVSFTFLNSRRADI